ncbi:MAG: YdcF family protein, partial [Ahrensia sp.]
QPVAGIIVLGGGFDGRVTRGRGGYALGEAGDRFTEAVTLAQRYGEVPIIISGGDASFIGTTEGDAAIAPRFFEALGVSASRVMLEDRSRNTHENAIFTAALIEDLPDRDGAWILVTSAFHMPRSVASFSLTPLAIIAWPVDYRTAGDERFVMGRDDPLRAIAEFNLAVREWIGIFVYRLTSRAAERTN